MFYIGALPALLALVLRVLLPESPRWLAVHRPPGRGRPRAVADRAETQKSTGQPLPPPQPVIATSDRRASLSDLFGESICGARWSSG